MGEQTGHKSLGDLPNEILFEILKWLEMSDTKYGLLRGRRSLDPLSRVNHGLRAKALELLRHKVICRDIEHLKQVTNSLKYNHEANSAAVLGEEQLEKVRNASLVRYESLDGVLLGIVNLSWYIYPGPFSSGNHRTILHIPTSVLETKMHLTCNIITTVLSHSPGSFRSNASTLLLHQSSFHPLVTARSYETWFWRGVIDFPSKNSTYSQKSTRFAFIFPQSRAVCGSGLLVTQ